MAVSDAVKHGRLRASVGRDENNQPKIANVELAKKEWLENGDYSRAPHMAPTAAEIAAVAGPAPQADAEVPGSMLDAGTRQKHWNALLAEAKYKKTIGTLILASEVQREWTETLAQCRTKLLALPSQVRQAIPALTLDDVVLVENLVRAALEDLVEDLGTASADDGGAETETPDVS